MKRLLVTLLLLAAAGTAAAQDRILKTDRSTVEARVVEVAPDAVRYKRFSNPDGPTYLLPVSQIVEIRYANGEVDRFAAEEPAPEQIAEPAAEPAPVPPAAPAAPAAPAVEPAAVPAAVLRYAVGDWYDRDGVTGVVAVVTDDGCHGLILSAAQATLPWDTAKKGNRRTVGADDRSDGRVNQEAVARYIAQTGGSWEEFPAFAWCRALGEGWYLPSIGEWLEIGFSFSGGDRARFDRRAHARINDPLKSHGGKRLDVKRVYTSSTEQDEKDAFVTTLDSQPPYVHSFPKQMGYLIRAVHRF